MQQTEYNYMWTSKGANDECITPREGVEVLLPYIFSFCSWSETKKSRTIIWCPFDTKESEFYKVLTKNGYNVTVSDIKTGQDYFSYEPPEWDIMLSNPPFTHKRQIFERALSLNKPFALLMTAAWLNDKAPCELFQDKGLQLLIFKDRMRFKNQEQKHKINFKAIYYCRNFLPRDLIIEDLYEAGSAVKNLKAVI